MTEDEIAKLWEANAPAWTALARAGFDVYRDRVNTPAFLAMLPPIDGRSGVDIGCGEGFNTRLLARAGAAMHALDIAPSFVQAALAEERREPLGIDYAVASALRLPYAVASFDFATAFMSLMDVGDFEVALREAFRVVRPGGFFAFSITHPCFGTPGARSHRDADGVPKRISVDYFGRRDDVDEWLFALPDGLAGGYAPFRIASFNRTIAEWMNAVLDAGFAIERVAEPRPSEDDVRAFPRLAGSRAFPLFLHILCRKAGAAGL